MQRQERSSRSTAPADSRSRKLSASLTSLGRQKLWEQAIAVLEEALGLGVEASTSTINSVISACARAEQWEEALSRLHEMPQNCLPPDTISYSAAIGSCKSDASWPYVLALWLRLRRDQAVPDLVACSSACDACSVASGWVLSMALFRAACLDGLEPDQVVLNTHLAGPVRGGHWKGSLAMLKRFRQLMRPNAVTFSTCLHACGEGLQWALSLHLLREMKLAGVLPNVISYSSIVRACVKADEDKMVVELIKEMRISQVWPNSNFFSGAISAATARSWILALWLLEDMRVHGVLPDASMFGYVVSACGGAGEWAQGLAVLANSQLRGEELPAVACGALLGAMERACCWRQAMEVVDQMKCSHVELNIVALSTAITSSDIGRPWWRALDLFAQLPQGGLQPDPAALAAAIGVAGVGQQWELALELLRSARLTALEPGERAYNGAISALLGGQEWEVALALHTFVAAAGVSTSLVTINTAISSAEKGSCWELAIHLLGHCKAKRLQPDVVTLTTALDACGGGGRWEEAASLMMMLPERGLRHTPVTRNAAINAFGKSHEWQQALHCLGRSSWLEGLAEGDSFARNGFNAALLACVSSSNWQTAFELWDLMTTVQSSASRPSVASFSLLLSECEYRFLEGQRELLQNLISSWLWAAPSSLAVLGVQDNAKTVSGLTVEVGPFPLPLRQRVPDTARFLGAAASAGLRAAPYEKELRLLHHVLEHATAGDPSSVCTAIEDYGEVLLGPSRQWLKVAGGSKAQLITAAGRGAPCNSDVLEIGAYCGYSALRLSNALPDARVATLEVDPAHALIARNVVAFAGLGPPRLTVWIGYSRELIPRLSAHYARPERQGVFGMVYMDQRGSRYDEDLAALESLGLLRPGAVLVADNVLKPGAPLLLWRLAKPRPDAYEAVFVSLEEFAMPVEDWMAVAVVQKPVGSEELPGPREGLPKALLKLHRVADRIRQKALNPGRGVDFVEWRDFVQVMKQGLAELGIEANARFDVAAQEQAE